MIYHRLFSCTFVKLDSKIKGNWAYHFVLKTDRVSPRHRFVFYFFILLLEMLLLISKLATVLQDGEFAALKNEYWENIHHLKGGYWKYSPRVVNYFTG